MEATYDVGHGDRGASKTPVERVRVLHVVPSSRRCPGRGACPGVIVQRPNAALARQISGFESPSLHRLFSSFSCLVACLRMHLVKQLDCRSSEGSSILLGGAAFSSFSFLYFWGDISTGRILPSHGRDRGSSPRRSTRTSRRSWVTYLIRKTTPRSLFVRPPIRRRGGWPLTRAIADGRDPWAGRLVSGIVAHLGERLAGSQEVVGSTPTGST